MHWSIVKFKPEGAEVVRSLSEMEKTPPPPSGSIVSGGRTQEKIDWRMEEVVSKFKPLFKRLRRAKGVDLIHIEIDNSKTLV